MFAPKIASLIRHPATASSPCAIDVAAEFHLNGSLTLRYRVTCPSGQLRLPPPQARGPADGLWQHTCCEAFVAEAGGAYREFNFSPSGQWACYRFTGYRERDASFFPAAEPAIECSSQPVGFELEATLPAPLVPAGDSLAIGLTAVIEYADGHKQYWALAHCAAQPDFHLRPSFTLTLNRNAP